MIIIGKMWYFRAMVMERDNHIVLLGYIPLSETEVIMIRQQINVIAERKAVAK